MYLTLITTAIALVGFAANSILCRLALEQQAIDAASFAVVRLGSGTAALVIILAVAGGDRPRFGRGRWTAALLLFAYAAAFAYAYNSLDAGIGALVLFAAVQVSMVVVGVLMGDRLSFVEWGGMACACSGFVVLLFPGLTAPAPVGVLLMALAGCAWGGYTLLGKLSTDSLADTAGNFVKSLPFAAILLIFGLPQLSVSPFGFLLAVISGAVTTSLIYVVWYVALRGLTIVQGAVVQLLVPVIAAFGGALFLHERVTARLLVASAMILGGILTVIMARRSLSDQATGTR